MDDFMLQPQFTNTPAFISGSRAYGEPKEDSDTDLCIYMPDCTDHDIQQQLIKLADSCDGKPEYGGGRLSLKFGKLNIIIHADLCSYRAWQKGTEDLKEKKRNGESVTRIEAGRLFDDLEDEYLNQTA